MIMIHTRLSRLVLSVFSLSFVVCSWASAYVVTLSGNDDDKKTVLSTANEKGLIDPYQGLPDSIRIMLLKADSIHRAEDAMERFEIKALARAYGDSVALRWAPSEYVPWKFLNGYGYDIVRGTVRDTTIIRDTIAYVRAWNRFDFQKKFAANDTLAAAAVQTIFGQGTTLNNTQSHSGSAGSLLEVYEEQQNVFGFAMFIAEMRPDLAKAMGLMYVDRNVKKGETYFYDICPHIPDTTLRVFPAFLEIENVPYVPKPCEIELADSLTSVNSVSLIWPYATYSAYNIERRKDGEREWRQINTKPYISMNIDFSNEIAPSIYVDENLTTGTYHYRLRGLDSFGNWSAPGPEHTVVIPDLIPPAPPVIKLITIDRQPEAMWARIDFHKDVVEDDLVGYIPFYQFNVANEEGEEQDIDSQKIDSVDITQAWVPLLKDRLIAPRDSSVTVDISGLSSGMVTIAAVDSAMNMTYAMPMPIRIVDLVPPEAPSNVRSHVSPEGVVTLVWSPSPSLDVHFYEVFLANDTTHTFMLAPGNQILRDTVWNDTLSMQVNQAFKYYKVRAIDYSGNNSEFTPVHQCMRPNFTPPSECWSDSIWHDFKYVYTRWNVSPEKDIDIFTLYRRKTKDRQWTKVREWNRSDFEGNVLVAIDDPEPEQVQRYYYAMTAKNMTGVSTGLSQAICIWHQGQRVYEVDIKLEGTYRSENGETILGWTIPEALPLVAPYHFVIERQLQGEDFFRPYRSVDYDNRTYSDMRLKPGESTKYRIRILYEDGRSSTYSNEVSVTAPEKK